MARMNETGAHFALAATTEKNAPRIGVHFHKPAPGRAARAETSALLSGLAWIAPVLALGAFLVAGL